MAAFAIDPAATSGTSTPKKPSVSVSQTVTTSGSNPADITDVSGIVSKAVFVKVRFGSLGNSRKVSGEVLDTDADASYLKVSKTLLDSAELDAIHKADGKMRTWLYNTCLPYDMGIMLLPLGLIETAQGRMNEYKIERAQLIENFITAYPGLCESAAQHLGSLYNASDYPSVEHIRAKFTFDWQYVSFGVPGHLKGISEALFQNEQDKAAERMQAATEEITFLMRQTLHDLVSHLQDRLTPGDDGRPRIIRETAVANVMEFLNSFDLRNVTNDEELAVQVKMAKELLKGTDAASLRNSDLLREKIRVGMANVKSSLTELVENKPGRKFRTLD